MCACQGIVFLFRWNQPLAEAIEGVELFKTLNLNNGENDTPLHTYQINAIALYIHSNEHSVPDDFLLRRFKSILIEKTWSFIRCLFPNRGEWKCLHIICKLRFRKFIVYYYKCKPSFCPISLNCNLWYY